MIDLDREMRALLEEDAQHTPPPPEPTPVLRRTRRRQVGVALATVAVVAAVALGSVAGVAALVRTSERRIPIGPGETPSPPPVTGFTCPAGSTSDLPGPTDQARPPQDAYTYAATTFDPLSGRMLLLTADGAFWTFDVCANTWETAPGPDGINGGLTELVHDADTQRVIAIERDGAFAQVWTTGPDGVTWTKQARWEVGAVPNQMFGEPLQAAYDPVTGLVLVRDPFTSAMASYDIDTDTWAEVDQGTTLPPVVKGTTDPPVELLTYDASVHRLILYVTKPLGTWEFDISASRWEEQDTNTPGNPGFGWIPTGEELVYDEANEVSVLFSGETVATYDATEHRWDVLEGHLGGNKLLYFAMTYDPVNARVVVVGDGTDDVSAFDVASGTWITLLEPSAG